MKLDKAIKKHIPFRVRDRVKGWCPVCKAGLKKYGTHAICMRFPKCRYGIRINRGPENEIAAEDKPKENEKKE